MRKYRFISMLVAAILPIVLLVGIIPITPLEILPKTSLAASTIDVGEFKFEVTTTAANQAFAIPLSGQLNNTWGKAYNWHIDWGDGSSQIATSTDSSAPQNSTTSNGIPYTYTGIGTYAITITPNGSTDAWLGAFGFSFGLNGANIQANKNRVTKIISPLTLLMTRTQAQLNNRTAPSYEWANTFYGCTNLTMGDSFNFYARWNSITTVGSNFANRMFASCNGASFTMNDVFNLPQGITTVGASFAEGMFIYCSGTSFNMNNVFNLPQGITSVGVNFAETMFYECKGASFTMNSVFNLPQGLATVNTYFTYVMFGNCSGSSFMVNDVFAFPALVSTQLNRQDVFWATFRDLGTATTQTRTAISIINGNGIPTASKNTFTLSNCFVDRSYLHTNWGGDGTNANNILILSHNAKTFPTVTRGYAPVTPQTITIYNLGTTSISGTSISLTSGNSYFDISGLSASTIPAGGSVTFTVAPKTGLVSNTYSGTISISATSCATITIPLSFAVKEEPQVFQFKVSIANNGEAFAIPLSGQLNNIWDKAYDWHINWGDSSTQTIASGDSGAPQNSSSSDGISHTYAAAGTYTITITPNGSIDAWLRAFGFNSGTSGANSQANKNMVTQIISPLTPLMTRTQSQLNDNTAPSHEWTNAFNGCTSLTMGDSFNFSTGWNLITTVGVNFASGMFSKCSGDDFTMNNIFNLPQGITTAGDGFASSMFNECSGAAFTMNDVFTLPQSLITVGNNFVSLMFNSCSGDAFTMGSKFTFPQGITSIGNWSLYNMFAECSGAAFSMNDVFNLPQSITSVGYAFACNMFSACSGDGFIVNDVFAFPLLSQTDLDQSIVFYEAFANMSSNTVQTRTATSIINGNGIPSDSKGTFTSSNCFVDRPYIHTNWGGGGNNANNILILSHNAKAFPTVTRGYAPVTPQTITIYNLGTTSISETSISLTSGSSFFDISGLSASTIPAGGNVTFTIAPKTGLISNTYSGTINVSATSCATKNIPLSFIVKDKEEFQFKVTVPSGPVANRTFAIPLSGQLNAIWDKEYDWHIDWGDGSSQIVTSGDVGAPRNSSTSEGIPHTYAGMGTYTITIIPNGSIDAWLGAFGFNLSGGANSQANKNRVNEIISPLTPLMTRTQNQLIDNTAPSYEWARTFTSCANLTMGDYFNLPHSFTIVGDYFADFMFMSCTSDAFTMNSVFNLPQGITTVGINFAYSMFNNCYGNSFTMNSDFNLPQSITTVGTNFVQNLFSSCDGTAFTMNDVFNLPQGITSAGHGFANGMFRYCSGGQFVVNEVFKFPNLNLEDINKNLVFTDTFGNLGTTPAQTRTAASIINGNNTPDNAKYTFTGSDCFSDRQYIHINWGGEGIPLPVNNIAGSATVIYTGQTINLSTLSGLFTIDPKAGALAYSIELGGTGEGVLNGTILTVSKTGTFNIGLTTAAVTIYNPYSYVSGTTVTGVLTVIPAQYTITYNGNGNTGGTVPTTAIYAYGNTAVISGNTGNLVKTGYKFIGWATDPNATVAHYPAGFTLPITSSITLYAVWETLPVTYTVTYNGNGHTSGTAPVDNNSPYNAGSTVTVMGQGTLVRTGYTFLGWANSSSATSPTYGATFVINSNTTLFAVWQLIPVTTYTVTYNGNGSTGGSVPVDSTAYTSGSSVTVRANTGNLVRTGYTFKGWATTSGATTPTYVVNGSTVTPATFNISANTTLYAVWEANPQPITYTVTYNGNNHTSGTVPLDTKLYSAGDTVTVLGNSNLTRATNYTFLGWSTNQSATTAQYVAGSTFTINSNTTLYAVWKENAVEPATYTVTYNGNGNTGGIAPIDSNSPYNAGSKVTVAGQGNLVRDGYTFKGWATSQSATAAQFVANDTFTANSNTVLYAIWSENSGTGSPIIWILAAIGVLLACGILFFVLVIGKRRKKKEKR